MDPVSELPVAALNRVPRTLVRSGPPPPPEGRGRFGGGGLRGGGTLSLSGGGGLFLVLDLQQTVLLGQELMFGTMVQTVDII